MNYIKYNHNPFNIKTGDCVIRAVGFALNETWQDTYKGMMDVALDMGFAISCKDNYEEYLKRKGIPKQKMPKRANGKRYRLNDFIKELAEPNKTYIIKLQGHHLTCVKDLAIYDTWYCGEKCVLNYWVV